MIALLLAALLGSAEAAVLPLHRVTPSVSALPCLTLPPGGKSAPGALPALTPSLPPSLPLPSGPAFTPEATHFAPEGAAPLAGLFDGSSELPARPLSASDLSSWLDVSDPRVAEALEQAAELASRTTIGRRALREAAMLLRDAPLPVDAADLGKNHGEFDYLDRRLRLHRKLLRPEARAQLADTLIHELRHVIQHAQGIPAEALEMEIEAHLDDIAFMAELGIEPPPNTFARQLSQALEKGPEAFVELLEAALPGRPRLAASSLEDIEADLEQELSDARRGRSKRKKKLAAAVERDLELIRSKEGRAAYLAFSRRVEARLKRAAGKVGKGTGT